MPAKTRTIKWLLLLSLTCGLFTLSHGSRAQSETPNDLVNAVNSLRARYDLEPYQVDPGLMAYAQEHSEYQARLQSGTHLHSDGKLPWEIGIQENVASGDEGIVTVVVVVNEIWVDWGHRHVLTGYPLGQIGAGIARGENGQVYYTVDIRPAAGVPTVVPEADTPVAFIPFLTSTPESDGAIYHLVNPGEALWSIAISYGVRVDDIRNLNGIAPDSNMIRVGQKLLIQPASADTPSTLITTPQATTQTTNMPTIHITSTRLPTRTILPSTKTGYPTSRLTSKPTGSPAGILLVDQTTIGVIGLVIAILGFVLLMVFGFRRKSD